MFRNWLCRLTLFPLIALFVVLPGCSDDTKTIAPDSDEGETLNLEDEFGGYASTDERPAFDDAVVVEIAGETAEVADNVATDPETSRIETEDTTRIYAMTLRWGHFGGVTDLGGNDRVDWSGVMRVNGDARIVLLNTISFESGDAAVLPREDPQLLEWKSMIQNGHDGVRVVVLQPVDEISGSAGDSLYLTTEFFNGSFALDEMGDFDNLMDVSDSGLQMRLQSIEVDDATDINTFQGWLEGRWRWSSENNQGSFRGVWVNPRAGAVGHVRGHFGINKAGENVFFGKYIDREGHFEGFLRGSFSVGEGDVAQGRGVFQGNWFSAERDDRGRIIGRWATRAEDHGFFSGKWCSGRCF